MNQSAIETQQLAEKLGGEEFVSFTNSIRSGAMKEHIFPVIAELAEEIDEEILTKVCRTFDKAFCIGLYEAWRVLKARQ